MSTMPVKCSCGAVQGEINDIESGWGQRNICMCDDCQAYAHFLQRGHEILDSNGGTDIFQTTPSQLRIRQGSDHLACVRLGPKGIFRWHTACCQTPVGNTQSSAQVPFVDIPLIFMNLGANGGTIEEIFGPARYRIYGRFGYGNMPNGVHEEAPFGLIVRTLGALIAERMKGHHLPSPFFDTSTGEPICQALLLDQAQRAALVSK